MTRQACQAVAIAVAGGAGVMLTGGSAHDAIRYGIALLTGALIAFGLAPGRSR